MDKIIGTNLGNWLVLEKWMQPFIFQGTGAEDETWLNRNVPNEKLWPMNHIVAVSNIWTKLLTGQKSMA